MMQPVWDALAALGLDVEEVALKIRNPKAHPKPEPEPIPEPIPEPEPEPTPEPEPEPEPEPAPTPAGIPFGPFGLFASNTTFDYGPAPFTLTLNSVSPSGLPAMLAAARAAGLRMILDMTGGSHSTYLTDGVFDPAKWITKLETFNTATCRDAIAAGVADGTILAACLIDEANHSSWGGAFSQDAGLLDVLARESTRRFPTLPTAVTIQLGWHDQYVYTDVDYLIHQFSYDLRDVGTGEYHTGGDQDPAPYRDRALALAAIHQTKVIFSLNWLDGGSALDGCPVPATGGPGTVAGQCRMTIAQAERAADVLTERGAYGLLFWRCDPTKFPFTAEQMAGFAQIAARLATRGPHA
jgi:hypothetical protein